MKNIKIPYKIALCTITLTSTLAIGGCTEKGSGLSDWQTQVEADLNSVDHDLKQLKAEIQGDDLEAAKQEVLSEAEEIRTKIENKLKKAKNATAEEASELKKDIETAMSNLKKKVSTKN